MDFELNEAGMTLLAGAFVALCVMTIARYVFGYRLVARIIKRFPRATDGSTHTALISALFVSVCFAVGLLIEDVCYKVADRYALWPYHWTHYQQYSSDHKHSWREKIEFRLQQSVLFENVRDDAPKKTFLGEVVIQSHIFRFVLGAAGKELEEWSDTGCRITVHNFDSIDTTRQGHISKVFFFAKNRVYANDNYFAELRAIDSQQEFSSTIATLSLAAAIFSLIAGMMRHFTRPWPDRFVKLFVRRIASVVGIFMAIYTLAYVAFIHESEEFNRRVFGYYDSMLRNAGVAHSSYPPPVALP